MSFELVPDQIRAFMAAAFPGRVSLDAQVHAARFLIARATGGVEVTDALVAACRGLGMLNPPLDADVSVQANARRVEILAALVGLALILKPEPLLVEVATTPGGGHRLAPRALGRVPNLDGDEDPGAGEGLGKLFPIQRVANPGVPVALAPRPIFLPVSASEAHDLERLAGVATSALEPQEGGAA